MDPNAGIAGRSETLGQEQRAQHYRGLHDDVTANRNHSREDTSGEQLNRI